MRGNVDKLTYLFLLTYFKVGVDSDDHIRVERSKALHELVESHKKSDEHMNVKMDPKETFSTSPFVSKLPRFLFRLVKITKKTF